MSVARWLLLAVLVASRGRWELVAVWHALLNAVGSTFFIRTISGDEKVQLGVLLAAAYAVVAVVVRVVRTRRRADRDVLAAV